MTHWNHRVIRREQKYHGRDHITYGIYEVYYDKEGLPFSCSAEPIDVSSQCLQDMGWLLEKMTDCMNHPILDYDQIGNKHDK